MWEEYIMSKLLEVNSLTGGYTHRDVIYDLSFYINRKEIFGLIVLNGAGKRTTIKNVIVLMKARKGEIKINGQTFLDDPYIYRKQMAYIPEQPILYDELTLYEHLKLTSMAYGLSEDLLEERLPKLLKEFRLERQLHWFLVRSEERR